MAQSVSEQVRSMALLLLKPYEVPTTPNIIAAVRVAADAVQGMGATDGVSVDQKALVAEIEAMLDVWMPEGKELLDETGHLAWLPDKRSQIKWQFWRRYEQYLEQEKHLPQLIVSRLNSLTDRVLENLEDPTRRGPWDRRGMVVGQVQSGKTSNYTGLICKAVDAGYKLIIVLAGTHNSLRSQTQLRLDEGFLGRDTQQSRVFTKESAKMGVGCIAGAGDLPAHSLTTSSETGDFKKSQANNVAAYIGGDPVILVIKKNGSVLKNLIQWVQAAKGQKDSEGRYKIKNLPMLLLDDEADNASSGAVHRPQREQLLKQARRRELDAILVWRLDRWGRSLADLITSLQELNALGVGFVSLTEALDMTTPTGRAMAGLLAVFAEFERNILRERVKAGIAQARQQGKPHGRPRTVANQTQHIRALHAQGMSKAQIARKLGIARTSVRRLLGSE